MMMQKKNTNGARASERKREENECRKAACLCKKQWAHNQHVAFELPPPAPRTHTQMEHQSKRERTDSTKY